MRSILIIDDEVSIRSGLGAFLENVGFEVAEASSLAEGRKALGEMPYDAILLGASLADGSGVDFIIEVRNADPSVPIIMMTGQGTIPMAVEAMRRGADHFLTKPVDPKELEVYLDKSLQIGTLRRSNRALRERPPAITPFFGQSEAWRAIMPLIEAACKHRVNVLVRGEAGTGKGLLARYIHANSWNNGEPFVELNCAGLRGEVLETELFGHTKGAFTDAGEAKEGLLGRAHRGTLFLDEIGDMDAVIQAKILKVLEEKRFRPLGHVDEKVSDFRLVSATRQDLDKRIQSGGFRQDLFFRINTLVVSLPPLRERRDDLPGLASHILRFISGHRREPTLSPQVLSALAAYDWPGNERELHNVLERAWILADGQEIRAEHLAHLTPCAAALPETDEAPRLDLDAAEKTQIIKVLKQVRGKVPEAAKLLGVSRPTLYRKIIQHEIDLKQIRPHS